MANHRQLERQSASGLSIQKWCRDNGTSELSFYVWQRELRKRDREPEQTVPGLAEHERREYLPKDFVSPGFVAVDAVDSDAVSAGCEAKLEIAVAGGIVIRQTLWSECQVFLATA